MFTVLMSVLCRGQPRNHGLSALTRGPSRDLPVPDIPRLWLSPLECLGRQQPHKPRRLLVLELARHRHTPSIPLSTPAQIRTYRRTSTQPYTRRTEYTNPCSPRRTPRNLPSMVLGQKHTHSGSTCFCSVLHGSASCRRAGCVQKHVASMGKLV